MTDDASDALPGPGPAGTPETPAETPPAETPAADPTPVAETPASGSPTTPDATGTPTVEAPAAAAAGTAEIPTAAPVTAVPVAAAPVAAAPARPSGIHVPTWVAAVVGALIVFALGLGIGYAVGDNHDGGNRSVQAPGAFGSNGGPNGFNGQLPFGNGNSGPFGNGNGGGNGGGQPPSGRNGNGNNGNGSNGSTTATVFLGVAAQDSTNPEGAELARVVAGSPAADAGLKTGDVITKFDGTSISGASDLTAAVHAQKAGATVTITYTRDGQSDTTQATLAGSSDFSRQ